MSPCVHQAGTLNAPRRRQRHTGEEVSSAGLPSRTGSDRPPGVIYCNLASGAIRYLRTLRTRANKGSILTSHVSESGHAAFQTSDTNAP